MSDTPKPKRKIVRTIVKAIGGIISAFGILLAFVWYANRSTERDAQVFCDGIPLGSDISLAIEKFESKAGYKKEPGGKVSALHYGFPQEGFPNDSHTFLFNGFMFDKAYCAVSLSANGKVVSKNSFMQYD